MRERAKVESEKYSERNRGKIWECVWIKEWEKLRGCERKGEYLCEKEYDWEKEGL